MPDNPSSRDFGPSTQQFDPALTRDALPTGTRLGGYQIVELLGRGGFGIVYLALDSSLQRQVAIKEYFPAELATRRDDHQISVRTGADANAYASGKAAFLNEAKMLARFDHPSLARVHSFWEENRSAYMVMPYYEGHSLAATLAAMSGPPDEAWLRALLTPLLSALSTLHASQCMHLDISPENIMVLGDGRPVLIDFGVANRWATDKTLPLTALLNPAYAPIEQYNVSEAMPQGPWTDLYALAGVLHFAITGQPPARATVRAVDDPQRPLAEIVRTLNKGLPHLSYSGPFLAAIDKALSVRPRDRPRDVVDFQQWLDRAPAAPAAPAPSAQGKRREPVFAPSTQGEESFTREPSRGNLPLWIAGLSALALGFAGFWTWQQMQVGPTVVYAPPAASTQAAPLAAPAALPVEAPAPVASAVAVAASEPVPATVVAPAPAIAPAPALAPPPPSAPPAPAVAAVIAALDPRVAEPEPPPKPSRKAEEAATPRAACGTRANFSLLYCMQTQCKKPSFVQHPQCVDLRRRGEVN
ncbi:MAG: serine/threonine protein kinase [Rhizobacter sp.]|nr:serine/threonine protein kinase [Rhizobacter sp.]